MARFVKTISAELWYNDRHDIERKQIMKTGIIDVGGGMRGIYCAGVLDRIMDDGICFDYCAGVSAGSANLSTYMAGQRGRTFRFYMDYSFRKEYMSARNFLFKRSYIDMDYVYGTLSNEGGEDPLDYDAFERSEAELNVVAMDALTGEPKYFTKDDMSRNNYAPLKASCCIPVVCRPYVVDGRAYFDGGMADPVPIAKAFDDGCDKVVVLLTKPRDFLRTPDRDAKPARLLKRRYPASAMRLMSRFKTYNDSVALAKRYEAEGRALIIAPSDTCGVDTLTRDKSALQALYEKGLADGAAAAGFIGRSRA